MSAAASTRVALDNLIPVPILSQNQYEGGPIAKSERLGGLLKNYYRASKTENGKEESKAA